jgi:hypothetical protein
MDKKTYEALKRIMKSLNLEYQRNYPDLPKDAIQVNDWIDEVAKEYVDEKERLEYLRGELRAEKLSYGELAELESLAKFIEPGDVELLEAAGVPEKV